MIRAAVRPRTATTFFGWRWFGTTAWLLPLGIRGWGSVATAFLLLFSSFFWCDSLKHHRNNRIRQGNVHCLHIVILHLKLSLLTNKKSHNQASDIRNYSPLYKKRQHEQVGAHEPRKPAHTSGNLTRFLWHKAPSNIVSPRPPGRRGEKKNSYFSPPLVSHFALVSHLTQNSAFASFGS